MSKQKKTLQLGMNPSTASGRLVKDLLFDFVEKSGIKCYRCNGDLTRNTFSIEHKKPWLDSENPVELFFDLGNIAFSHLSCNASAARREKGSCPSHGSYAKGCRCTLCTKFHAETARNNYCPTKRKNKYQRTGH